MDVKKLIRPNIAALVPYSTARDEYQGSVGVFLDANESPFDNGCNRYPDPRQSVLKSRIAELKGVGEEQIFVGNGSDEAIDLCFRIFCEPAADNAVAIVPSYGMYGVAAAINNVELREVPLDDDFGLPVERLLAAGDAHTRLMFVCSPNNPTGNAFCVSDLLRLADGFDGVLVVDEAYVDFSSKGSLLSGLAEHPNIVVLQTLSKAWGMAGLRVGLAFGTAEVMQYFARVKYPYNINCLAQQRALQLLADDNSARVELLCRERERVAARLGGARTVRRVYASDANFLLVKVADADRLYERLITGGVIVRNRTRCPMCEDCLRITVGTPDENDKTIEIIEQYE